MYPYFVIYMVPYALELRQIIPILVYVRWFFNFTEMYLNFSNPYLLKMSQFNHELIWQLFNQVIQSCNHKGGGFLDLSTLKVAVLVNLSVIIAVSPEEDAFLMQPASQSKDPTAGSHSPRNEAGTVSGEMANLSLTSPSQPGPGEDETQQ